MNGLYQGLRLKLQYDSLLKRIHAYSILITLFRNMGIFKNKIVSARPFVAR
jgi:hypothetical protein